MTTIPTAEDLTRLYEAAIRLGASEAYNGCVGGDITLRGVESPTDECVAACREYWRAAKDRDAYLNGPARREYYSRD